MNALRHFARTYPARTAGVGACLLLAALVEGVGWSAALPLLSIAAGRPGPAGEPSALERGAEAAFRALGAQPTLGALVAVVVLGFALKAAILLLAKRQVGYTVAQVATDLRLGLLRALLRARFPYFARQRLGLAANALASEAERASLAYHHVAQILALSVEAALYVALALAVSWPVTLAAALAALAAFVGFGRLVRMARSAGRRQTRRLRSLLARLADSLRAVRWLKATGREASIGPLLEEDTRALNRALRTRIFSKEALRVLQEPLVVVPGALGLYAAVTWLGMPLARVALLIALFARTLTSANQLQRKRQALAAEESALEALLELTARAEAEAEPNPGRREPTLERGVTLEGVRVAHDGVAVLEDFWLEIPAGRITALVGASGAGKTTAADLVTGLVRPDAGRVCVDGVPLDEIDLSRWRRRLGYVPQESLLLHESVRTNVTLSDPSLSDAAVESALRDAGAWDFVASLPRGVDAPVGENGALLSAGQRQRIAIARALVRDPDLLILDEATAALDPESEAALWSTLAALRGRLTVLAISHQPTLAAVADRVVRIEGGKAVETVLP